MASIRIGTTAELSNVNAVGTAIDLAYVGKQVWEWDPSSSDDESDEVLGTWSLGRWKLRKEAIDPARFGAVGDGVTDDTAALLAYFASGFSSFDLKGRTYKCAIPRGEYLAKWTGQNDIIIAGNGATIVDGTEYPAESASTAFAQLFWFDSCSRIRVLDVNYEGQAPPNLDDASYGLGYVGSSYARLTTSTSDVVVRGKVTNARHGVHTGDYTTPALGGCSNIRIDLDCNTVGYPLAAYLAENLDVRVTANVFHRSVYMAGVNGARVWSRAKNQHIASVHVILTDARSSTSPSASVGCRNIKVDAADTGSNPTGTIANSWLAGIAGQYSTPDALVHENLDFRLNVKSTDTSAPKVGAFGVFSSGGNYWNASSRIRNLRVSGSVDRSAQTIADNAAGELYVYAENANGTFPIVENIDISGLVFKKGSSTPSAALTVRAKGLTGRVRLSGCDFSDHILNFIGSSSGELHVCGKSKIKQFNDPGTTYPILIEESDITTVPAATVAAGIRYRAATVASSTRLSPRETGITASTTQTQGQGLLTAEINIVATCANDLDTVTLPSGAANINTITVVNAGAQVLQVFPSDGDDIGQGTNLSQLVYPGSHAVFTCNGSTTWSARVMQSKVTHTITASATQVQGQQVVYSEHNDVTTVTTANDVVTLPPACAGASIWIANNGLNTLQIFPYSGDNLGAGADTSTTLASGSKALFNALSTSFWRRVV